jgi:NADPH-dependent glutamate synthase beta subunit-like oxidoreductase
LNQPVDYLADRNGNLKGVRLTRTRLGGNDSSGRRKPVVVRGGGWTLEAQCAIEAIGNLPDDKARKLYPSLAVNKRGLILADEKNCRTSGKGIFAGGDIIRGPDLVVRAVRDGKTAAASIAEYLEKKRPAARRSCAAEKKQ